jgi:DNA-binding NtrC family response regulator
MAPHPPSRRDGERTSGVSIDRNRDLTNDLIPRLSELHRAGKNRELIEHLEAVELASLENEVHSQALVLWGSALYDLDDISGAIGAFRRGLETARLSTPRAQFAAAFALFTREGEIQSPEETLPALSELRQLAASLGNSEALGALHLAVARREGMRGNFLDARRHVALARRIADQGAELSTQCALDTMESSLDIVSGNFVRARQVAERGFQRASQARFTRYLVGCATNLSAIATCTGSMNVARGYIDQVTTLAKTSRRMRFCAIDNLIQIALFEGNTEQAAVLFRECADLSTTLKFPRPSWYELSHRSTRCLSAELNGDWPTVVQLVDEVDNELVRRELRALRTVLLCAKARALCQLDKHRASESTLMTAQRAYPKGAIEALIVLEASKGLCLARKGDIDAGELNIERSLAACRAIGHRYYEWWIQHTRTTFLSRGETTSRRNLDVTSATLLLSDVTTILGAGQSIDLLTHRTSAVLESAFPDGRVDVRSESGLEYRPDFSSKWDQTADGTFRIRIRGSDRSIAIQVKGVQSLDEVSLVKSVADLVRAAVDRTAEGGTSDEDQNLWPHSLLPGSDDAVFQSPRMIELMKIAERLASSDLPILIGGETGTGKEVFARLIHEHSRVKRGPFVAYNCSAMPRDLVESQLFGHRRGAFTGATDSFPGLVRAAEHGTLFLDEVGDLDPAIQPKLLRFLEGSEIHPVGEMKSMRVPVRIVAATNADLDDLVKEGRFRRDLFYRLGVARLSLPPLRERKDEIPALAALFLSRYSRECHRSGVRLGDDLIAALLLYDWPGNIRQLANEIRRLVAMADDGAVLHSAALAPDITAAWNRATDATMQSHVRSVAIRLDQPLEQAVEELERTFVNRAMESAGGRVSEAAQLLGMSRKGLFLKRRRWKKGDQAEKDQAS